MKPFKPPSFINGAAAKVNEQVPLSKPAIEVPVEETRAEPVVSAPLAKKRKREPLLTLPVTVQNAVVEQSPINPLDQRYFTVVWRKPTTKKHKTWDGDAILAIIGTQGTLQNHDGKVIGKGHIKSDVALDVGDAINVGGKECEIEGILPREDFLRGKPFLDATLPQAPQSIIKSNPRTQFRNPLKVEAQVKCSKTVAQARHDPSAPNALVMSRPSTTQQDVVDVVVDPFIAQFLRPHQREGVMFLYDCLMQFKDYKGAGAVLADDMGLGKTLQSIALVWTLLKQNYIPEKGPLAQKIIIVCPVTLINNWKREFRKWLGQDRIGIFVVDTKSRIRDFLCGKVYQVMIIGYERLRMLHETDEFKSANIDLVICDEGHRLKSANNKAAAAIKALKTTKRIILSGTPIQNDLSEFFVMIDFVNPGLLGSASSFRREFEIPIVRARQPDASRADKEKGAARSAELSRITEMFILRRTSEILTNYLPQKTEIVLFCKPTKLQIEAQRCLLSAAAVDQFIRTSNSAQQLQAIMSLRKICNSVALLRKDADSESDFFHEQARSNTINKLISSSTIDQHSGKLSLLITLLQKIKSTTDEKVVIVSQFTQTLQILQDCLSRHSMTFVRLDGSTPSNKRQEVVDKFNRSPRSTCFAFLLSAKSGGCGLNLIGGSRLILYDSDWNPSVDLQAMARIHRDGQRKPVFIYRLLMTGMIDEKIYQRQVTKQGLSDALIDSKASGSTFSASELRDLFNIHQETECLTHDMLSCPCLHDGTNIMDDTNEFEPEDESTWKTAKEVSDQPEIRRPSMQALHALDHISPSTTSLREALQDDVLCDSLSGSSVSYIFRRITAMAES